MFTCKFRKNFKSTYFEEQLTSNGCLLICFMKIKHLPERDQKRYNSWNICQLCCCCTPASACVSQKPHVSTWSVLTNQISSLVWSNYKLSLNPCAEAPNKKQKLTFIKKRYSGHKDAYWICEQMRARNS